MDGLNTCVSPRSASIQRDYFSAVRSICTFRADSDQPHKYQDAKMPSRPRMPKLAPTHHNSAVYSDKLNAHSSTLSRVLGSTAAKSTCRSPNYSPFSQRHFPIPPDSMYIIGPYLAWSNPTWKKQGTSLQLSERPSLILTPKVGTPRSTLHHYGVRGNGHLSKIKIHIILLLDEVYGDWQNPGISTIIIIKENLELTTLVLYLEPRPLSAQ